MTSVLPSTTLFREGPDLEEILAELDEEYPGRVRVVDVEYDRSGGMLGFFAHRLVRVRYTVEDHLDDGPRHARDPLDAGDSPLEALLRAASADDVIGHRPGAAPRPVAAPAAAAVDDAPSDTNVEFARMLLDMAAAKAAARRAAEPTPDQTLRPEPAGATAATPTAPVLATLPSLPPPAAVQPVLPTAQPAWVPPIAPPPAPTCSTVPVAVRPHAAWTPAAADPGTGGRHTADPAPAPEQAPEQAPAPAPEPAHSGHQTVDPVQSQADPVPAPAPAYGSTADRAPASLSPQRRVDLTGRHRATASPARVEFSLRRALVEVGVPVHWVPEHAADAYRVVEDLAAAVRNAPVPRLQPGQVLAIVGSAVEALRTADQLSRQLRLDPGAVLAAGCAVPARNSLTHPWEVAAAVARARTERVAPVILVVSSDGTGDGVGDADDEWLRDVLRSAGAEHVWLVADATRKPADARAMLDTLDRVDALAVTGAARTASPASVWGLGVPVALLDGRPATRGGWAVLLIDKLAALES